MSALLDAAPRALLQLGAAFLLALYFTPLLRAAAIAHDIVDRPDGQLKRQRAPVAYLGGLAIYLAFLITLGLSPESFAGPVLGLLLGASIVLLLGVVDDLRAISPTVKFLGQLLAAWILLKSGIRIEIAFLVDRHPVVADLLTVLWIVGVTNAFNIIDVLDGLAAGVGAIALTFLFVAAVLGGEAHIPLFAISLAGAGLGFLRFNFHPATIYLGDAGSMLLGFLAGALSMLVSYTADNSLAVCAPLLILCVPLFDTAFVMILRLRRGIPVFRGSPDHFAVRLRKAGVPVRKIAAGAYAAATAGGVGAIALMRVGPGASLVILGAFAAAALIAGAVLARIGSPAPPSAAEGPSPPDAPPARDVHSPERDSAAHDPAP